ncbi:MAG: glycosyltransferase [Lachnospiraceae bacterium]|nr:glycosyltransferase [Lachnospiraceae bacterium]
MDYSVLMSVYHKENPDFLSASIESILNQTVKTNDFVIVCDGPLNEDLYRVIDDYCHRYPVLFHIIRLEKNMGLAHALNAGIGYCKNEIVARMDSDDIALPDRMEKQLSVIEDRNVDIVGGTVREFRGSAKTVEEIESDSSCLGSARQLPQEREEILSFAKKRSPFNHPSVMYKKSFVQKCGGYRNYEYFEDYNLWVSMLMEGAEAYNLRDILVYMRAGDEMYKRRGGLSYVGKIVRFKTHLKKIGFISTGQMIVGVGGHIAVGIMPNSLRTFVYKKLLRKNGDS